MTVSTSSSSTTLLGNGSNTSFVFPFIGVSASDIEVIYTDANGGQTTLLSSKYGLVLNPIAPGSLWGVGGTVTYPLTGPAIANGTSITINRIVPQTQETSIRNQGAFYPQATETALDTLEFQIQQVSARTGQIRGYWASGVKYNYGDVVQDGPAGAGTLNLYMCAIENESTVWATNLAAGDWTLALNIQNFNVLGSYLPLSGGTILGNLGVNGTTTLGNLGVNGTLTGSVINLSAGSGDYSAFSAAGGGTSNVYATLSNTTGYLRFLQGNNLSSIISQNDPLYIEVNGHSTARFDASGNTLIYGSINVNGTLTGSVINLSAGPGDYAAFATTGGDTSNVYWTLSNTTGYLRFLQGNNYAKILSQNDPIYIDTNGSTAVGIDTSQRLNVNSSGAVVDPASGSQDGVSAYPTGFLAASNNNFETLSLRRRGSDGNIAAFRRDTTLVGTISVTGAATSYNTSSDYRLKEDWRPLSKSATETLMGIPVYSLVFKAEPEARRIGFLAHEVQDRMPEAVTGTRDAVNDQGEPVYQQVDYSKMVPALLAMCQEQQKRIEALEDILKKGYHNE